LAVERDVAGENLTLNTAAGSLLRKVARDGIGYSVAELSDVRHVFAAAVPLSGSSLEEQAKDALQTIATVVDKEGTRASIVHQTVFIAEAAFIQPCRQLIHDFYGDDLPATTYVRQRPCNGKLLAIEAMGVGQGEKEVQIDRISEQLVIASHNDISWVHCAQVVPQIQTAGVYHRSLSAFAAMRPLLDQAGVRFDQIIRTWLYLGDIVGMEETVQRYQELNRARTDSFEGIDFLADRLPQGALGAEGGTLPAQFQAYPASTGIGTEDHDIMMSCIALATDRKDIVAVPLENPRQTAAYDYATSYSPKSPKFARAMALSCGSHATIFISGTASITHSETRHVGDPAAQTRETLDNIEALIGEDNLARHGLPGLGAALTNLGLVRVYIKRQEDYARIRAVCQERLGEVPTVYVIADVCRPELLVEIEGIAFSRRSEKGGAGQRRVAD
jgi:enamine deaminase RidA (YjgF/YER057c/UK114 family)